MKFRTKRAIYEGLPKVLQSGAKLVPYSLIAGSSYRQVLQRAKSMEVGNVRELVRYQEASLEKVLAFAVAKIPAYYRFRNIVAKHKPFDALRAFPLINKRELQENLNQYLPRNFDAGRAYRATTGGTSGNQLTVFWDNASQGREMAFIHRHMQQVGYALRHRKATFRGVPFPDLPPDVFWYQNPIHNELRFSPFHMSRGNLAAYVEKLLQYRPRYLHGYPSAISMLATYVLQEQMSTQMQDIRAAFLTSEACSRTQRERIEQAFGTRVLSWYGHTERLIFGGECEHNSSYHHFPDYGVLEIIDERGGRCEKEGDRGELIGTGLYNFSMPLIRYQTGDYATRLDRNCGCGRSWDRFTDVEGRWQQDMVVGWDGSQISIAALNMHGSVFDNVVRYQYFQDTPGVCVLRLMVGPAFSPKELAAIESAYKAKVGNALRLKAEIVPDIPLTSRGKLKLLDSKLEQDAS